MEMISPYQYRELNKDKSVDELCALKKELQEKIESMSTHEEEGESVFLSDVRPQIYEDYLKEIDELIQEKK